MTAFDDASGPGSSGVQQGREVCRGLLRRALLSLGGRDRPVAADGTARPGPRDAWLVDRAFGEWPLDEVEVLDSLSTWLRPGGRRLHIVGLDFETMARALPRFARWRRDWSHRIDAWRPADALMPVPLRGLLTDGSAWLWLDAPDWRLRVITDPVQVRAAEAQVADFLQHCEPAWPVTTLGL